MIDQNKITKAWFFASRAHNGQLYPGEKLPYITHIGNVMMEVLAISSSLKNPELAICCAILHDSIEDTTTSYEEVEKEFGKAIADGVMALSKNETFSTKEEQMLDSLQRILKQPKEVWAVKMADRISNLGEPPHYWNSEKRKRYQNEAKIILEHLGEGNEFLALRLQEKIENYSRYF